ncbi:hypothetical protein [Streptomyces sp. NPDC004135]
MGSEGEQDPPQADEVQDSPQVNNVRITESGEAQYFDGTAWQLYAELPEEGPPAGPIIKGDDEGRGAA